MPQVGAEALGEHLPVQELDEDLFGHVGGVGPAVEEEPGADERFEVDDPAGGAEGEVDRGDLRPGPLDEEGELRVAEEVVVEDGL